MMYESNNCMINLLYVPTNLLGLELRNITQCFKAFIAVKDATISNCILLETITYINIFTHSILFLDYLENHNKSSRYIIIIIISDNYLKKKKPLFHAPHSLQNEKIQKHTVGRH